MLHVSLICIGKTNENYVKEGIEKYLKLLSKHCKFELIELSDVKNANKLPPDKLKEAEAEILKPFLKNKCLNIFLDENGIQQNSVTFANYFEKRTLINSKIQFFIGGAFGFDAQIKSEGELISISLMTFNHQMIRVIVLEQLFRAFAILKNTGYHH